MSRRFIMRAFLSFACLIVVAAQAYAQGSIGGVVRDTSGAVLPGVTVEASSEALIERTRSVVTDANGQYLLVNLRPGTYVVRFSLAGFNTVEREGLVVTSNVTLPVNVELAVGAVQETITVTGETPVVDVQNTQQQAVLRSELLEAVPRSRSGWATAQMLPGMTSPGTGGNGDVAGTTGDASMPNVAIHGGSGNDFQTAIDGLMQSEYSAIGTGERNVIVLSDLTVQEYVIETSGLSAENPSGGVRLNMIPRDGGNRFSPAFYTDYSTEAWTADNLTDRLKAMGVRANDSLVKMYDINGAIGGPIRRDQLWFFSSARKWGLDKKIANAFFETDPTRQARYPQYYWSADTRLTWQATPRNKFTGYFDYQDRHVPYWQVSSTRTPEASTVQSYPILYTSTATWTAPITPKLLIEAGGSFSRVGEDFTQSPPETRPGAFATLEVTTGVNSGRLAAGNVTFISHTGLRGSVSYVTGSHAFKAGFTEHMADRNGFNPIVPPQRIMAGGVPLQVVLFARPGVQLPRLNHDLGIFVQDQWRIQRLTLNLGLRFDYINAQIDAQQAPAGPFVGARQFAEIPNVPNWKDIVPRLGVAYDVFGNGKTALKGTFSKYVAQEGFRFANSVNPMTQNATDTRTWADNGDLIPQLNELGPSTNRNFGLPILSATPDPSLANGWGQRGYNWEYAASVQHELFPGLSATVGYTRRAYGNLLWTDNTFVETTDYTPFTFTNPIDGSRMTAYNLNPDKRGLINNIIKLAPDKQRIYNGVDVILNGKFGNGGQAFGGVSMGSTHVDECTFDNANGPFNVTANGAAGTNLQLNHCEYTIPFTAEAQYKFAVVYPLPYGIQTSATFQSIAGPQIEANYTITSAIAGVPLTLGSFNVNLLEPGSRFGDRANQLNLRFAKTFNTQGRRLQLMADIYNVFNSDAVLAVNNTYGPQWLRPAGTNAFLLSSIVQSRMMKLGFQVNF